MCLPGVYWLHGRADVSTNILTAEASWNPRQRGGGHSEEEMIRTCCHPRRGMTLPLEWLPKSTSLLETWGRSLRLVGVTSNMRKACKWGPREQRRGHLREPAGPSHSWGGPGKRSPQGGLASWGHGKCAFFPLRTPGGVDDCCPETKPTTPQGLKPACPSVGLVFSFFHWLNGHAFEQTPQNSEEQGSLACCSSWGPKESDTTERLNGTNVYLFGCARSFEPRRIFSCGIQDLLPWPGMETWGLCFGNTES